MRLLVEFQNDTRFLGPLELQASQVEVIFESLSLYPI